MLAACHRPLSSLRALTVREARALLGVSGGADAHAIKVAYFEHAKQSHPDLNPEDEDAAERFARAADAHDLLLSHLEQRATAGSTGGAEDTVGRTGSRDAGRGQGAPSSGAQGVRAHTAPRMPTAAELICQRLESEPDATREVWLELQRHRVAIDGPAMDSLFRACGGSRRDEALQLFEESAPRLSVEARRSALVSLLSWCHEEAASDWTFKAVGLVTPDDLTPEVQAALSRTFSYFPSGASF
jgi:curved DNA-binding protein CbpA